MMDTFCYDSKDICFEIIKQKDSYGDLVSVKFVTGSNGEIDLFRLLEASFIALGLVNDQDTLSLGQIKLKIGD